MVVNVFTYDKTFSEVQGAYIRLCAARNGCFFFLFFLICTYRSRTLAVYKFSNGLSKETLWSQYFYVSIFRWVICLLTEHVTCRNLIFRNVDNIIISFLLSYLSIFIGHVLCQFRLDEGSVTSRGLVLAKIFRNAAKRWCVMAVGNGCGTLFICLCCVYMCVMAVGNGCGILFRERERESERHRTVR